MFKERTSETQMLQELKVKTFLSGSRSKNLTRTCCTVEEAINIKRKPAREPETASTDVLIDFLGAAL